MTELERRKEALEKTLAKYRDKPICWGKHDCIHLARFHMIQMGHMPPPLPQYRSLLGARKALEKAGGLIAVFDSLLPSIAPARMLPGDVAVMEGEDGIDAAVVCVGTKVAGWHGDHETIVNMTPLALKGAWRV